VTLMAWEVFLSVPQRLSNELENPLVAKQVIQSFSIVHAQLLLCTKYNIMNKFMESLKILAKQKQRSLCNDVGVTFFWKVDLGVTLMAWEVFLSVPQSLSIDLENPLEVKIVIHSLSTVHAQLLFCTLHHDQVYLESKDPRQAKATEPL